MIKMVQTVKEYIPIIKEMKDMKPLEVGTTNDGRIVMRTASTNHFEVMDIERAEEDVCWTDRESCCQLVTLFRKGSKVLLEVFNEF